MSNFDQLTVDIRNGVYDEDLDLLLNVVRNRKDYLSQSMAYNLRPGDRVRFTYTVRPQYLQGVEATVRSKKLKKLIVDLDQPVGRFYRGVSVSPSLLNKI